MDARHWRVLRVDRTEAQPEAQPVEPPVPAAGNEFVSTAHALLPRRVATVADIMSGETDELWISLHRDDDDNSVDESWEEIEALYRELAAGMGPAVDRHRMFGWPDTVQTIGEAGDGSWVLLLQVSSGDLAGWEWGDCGLLHFWIRRQDLAAGRFDRVWAAEQSG